MSLNNIDEALALAVLLSLKIGLESCRKEKEEEKSRRRRRKR
jgi:hypothetical protein